MSFWSGTHTPKSVAWLDRNNHKILNRYELEKRQNDF